MPASTSTTIHVNGPLLPQCNIGSASAFVTLGECQDGATISIQPLTHQVKADGHGGMDGGEVEDIFLDAVAVIRFKLVPYAGTYLNKLRAMSVASATEGTLVVPGTLYGLNSFLPALYLPYGSANDGDGPWYFPFTRVVTPGDINVWTKETTPELEFRAKVWYDPSSVTSVSGRVLYTRAAPA